MTKEERHFDGFCLEITLSGEVKSFRLLCNGKDRKAEPKTLALLEILTSHPGKAIPRETLCAQLWPSAKAATAQDLQTVICKLNKSLKTKDNTSKLVQAVRRTSYRLLPGVSVEPPPAVSGPLAILKMHQFHRYHLTLDREEKPVWIYTIIDFTNSRVASKLEAAAPILLNTSESPVSNHYKFEAEAFGKHLLIKSHRENDNSDVCVELYPNLSTRTRIFTGARINDTWCPKVARSVSIMSVDKLFDVRPGPVSEPQSMALFEVWRERNQMITLPLGEAPTPDEAASAGCSLDFAYVGTGDAALKYMVDRIPDARKIEDTTVRWVESEPVYNSGMMAAYAAALRRSQTEFFSVTGPVQDEEYVQALYSAYSQRSGGRPSRGIGFWRLNHASPLMNFVLMYYDNEPTEVLFGYGTHRDTHKEKHTPVFRSTNAFLVKEFMRLFEVLCSPQFSHVINVEDPEFLRTRNHSCDVLATYHDGFPIHEIRGRIRECKRGTIVICMVAWSGFLNLEPELKGALERKCRIDFAFWDPDDPFVKVRNSKKAIEINRATLSEFKDKENVTIHSCRGQASVTIFWIDDLIFFSAYWVDDLASNGPHFLVRAHSPTGRFIKTQYDRMIGTA